MSYDGKCEDLAQQFLIDHKEWWMKHPGAAPELAQRIQDAIEDYLKENGL